MNLLQQKVPHEFHNVFKDPSVPERLRALRISSLELVRPEPVVTQEHQANQLFENAKNSIDLLLHGNGQNRNITVLLGQSVAKKYREKAETRLESIVDGIKNVTDAARDTLRKDYKKLAKNALIGIAVQKSVGKKVNLKYIGTETGIRYLYSLKSTLLLDSMFVDKDHLYIKQMPESQFLFVCAQNYVSLIQSQDYKTGILEMLNRKYNPLRSSAPEFMEKGLQDTVAIMIAKDQNKQYQIHANSYFNDSLNRVSVYLGKEHGQLENIKVLDTANPQSNHFAVALYAMKIQEAGNDVLHHALKGNYGFFK